MGSGVKLMIVTGVFALVAVACRQIVGIHDEPALLADASAGDGGACGISLSPGTCRACIESRCCSEAQRCGSPTEPACSILAECELGCDGDAQCRSQCTLDHAVGSVSSLPPLEACAATQCSDECNLPCGGSLPNIPPATAQKCQQCESANACSEFRACLGDVDCIALYRCRYACMTPDCATACDSANDAGYSAFITLAKAGLSHCVQDCQLGDDFACVGHVTWPFAKATTLDITLHVRDYSPPYAPVAGVKVKLCAASDAACATPLDANGVTDANGDAHVRLAGAVNLAPLVFFDLDSPDYAPFRYYPGFPFSAPTARLLQEVPILAKDLFTSVWTQVGFPPPIAGRGHVIVQSADCAFLPALGATFSASDIDPSTIPFYFSNNPFSRTATATDAQGVGGWENVPAGQSLTIKGFAPPLGGTPYGSVVVNARPDAVTVVGLQPTP